MIIKNMHRDLMMAYKSRLSIYSHLCKSSPINHHSTPGARNPPIHIFLPLNLYSSIIFSLSQRIPLLSRVPTMSSTPVNPSQACADLRRTFKEKADSILKELKSKSQRSYGSELGISVGYIKISHDEEFPDFKPLSSEEFRKYKFDESTLSERAKELYVREDFDYSAPPSVAVSDKYVKYVQAVQIYERIEILFSGYKKRKHSMQHYSRWYQIRYDPLISMTIRIFSSYNQGWGFIY